MLGRQQQLILLVEKDQQVLQFTNGLNNNNNKEKNLYSYAFVVLLGPFSLLQCLTLFAP
jgi:hypothetical protein